jgi:hypothetical protein
MTMIREAIERAFDMTLPSPQVEAIVQAIYDVAADRPRPASTDEMLGSVGVSSMRKSSSV